MCQGKLISSSPTVLPTKSPQFNLQHTIAPTVNHSLDHSVVIPKAESENRFTSVEAIVGYVLVFLFLVAVFAFCIIRYRRVVQGQLMFENRTKSMMVGFGASEFENIELERF